MADSASIRKGAPRPSLVVDQGALLGHYELKDTIGSGGFGKVKLAKHILTGETVAIKIMDKAALKDEYARAQQEIDLLMDLHHPRICRLFQVIETAQKLYLVLEYCVHGELFECLVKKERFPEIEARRFFRQIVSAVCYMHHSGCAHRDLKPENLLLDEKDNIKLIDFGLAARPQGGMQTLLDTCCGSPQYVAPELISGEPYLGAQADIWSLGVILYMLLVGQLPFHDENDNKVFQKIRSGIFYSPNYLTNDAKDLLKQMLQVNPQKRITMDQLICNRWVMGPYVLPVRWDFPEDDQIDESILQAMSPAGPLRMQEIRQSISQRKYDHWMATYLILKNRALYGKPVRINVAGLRMHNQENLSRDTRTPVRSCLKSPLRPPAQQSVTSVHHSNISFDGDSDSDADLIVNPSIDPLERSSGFVVPIKRVAKTPVKRREPSLMTQSWDVDLNKDMPLSDSECTRRIIGDKSKSMEDGLENMFWTPPKLTKAAQCQDQTTSAVRKMLGSWEKGMDRVKGLLTPNHSITKNGRTLHVLNSTKVTNNVNQVISKDPEFVLNGIQTALTKNGFQWKIKRGYIIRAKKQKPTGQLILKLSMEVVWISDLRTCGIRRKRLQGDTFEYRNLIALLMGEIMRVGNETDSSSTASVLLPQRLKF